MSVPSHQQIAKQLQSRQNFTPLLQSTNGPQFTPAAGVGSLYTHPQTKMSFRYTSKGWQPVSTFRTTPLIPAERIRASSGFLDRTAVNIVDKGVPYAAKVAGKEVGGKLIEFGKDVLRASPRAAASATLSVKGEKSFIPGTGVAPGVEKFLFGKKIIRDVPGTGEEFITDFGGSSDTAAKYGLPVGLALTALDVVPSIPKKKVATTIAKETSPAIIKYILKKSVTGLSDDAAEVFARRFAKIANPKVIQKELEFMSTVKRTELVGQALRTSSKDILKGRRGRLVKETKEALRRSEIMTALNAKKAAKAADAALSYNKLSTGMRGKWLGLRETAQDYFIRARKLQQSVAKGSKISDQLNIDQAETLFHGRVGFRLEQTRDAISQIDKDIVKTAKKLKVNNKQFGRSVDSFLHARHALERNARLGDGAAGLTNKQAKKILKQIADSPHLKQIKAAAGQISDLNKQTLNVLLDAEIIDQKLHKTLTTVYQNHVPLQRVLSKTDDIAGMLTGRGFDVKGTGIKRAKGSDLPVADILTNVTANVEQAIIRAEKNLVDLTTLRFARENKGLGLFTEIKPKAIGKVFTKGSDEARLLFQRINDDPAILTLREKGKPVYLKIHDQRLATALKGVGIERVPTLLRPIAFFTRFYSGLHTRFNYEFAFSNNIRDIQEMMVFASNRGGFKSSASVVKKDMSSKKAVFDFLMGKDTPLAQIYKQMKLDGGTTGGIALSTREQVALDIAKIRKLNRSKPRQAAAKAIETVDKWNTLFEDASRLSAYRTALDRGLSRKQAAVWAKEATVNFNKRGTAGPVINGLYMFSNASIQGTTRVLRDMKNPKTAAAVVTSIGGAVYAVNEWNNRVDKHWRDKITKWDRSANLTVMLPSDGADVSYITIPTAWGVRPIKVAMEYMYDAATGHGDIKDIFQGVTTAVLEAYNPLAGDEDILHTLTPTILKTPMEISRNRAWYGNMIKPDFDQDVPASAQYFKSLENDLVGKTAISGTRRISETTEGAIEISPADIAYAFKQYIGGVGRATTRVINTVSAIGKGEELPARERPILNRFLKQKSEDEVLRSLYYSEKERVSKVHAREKVDNIRRMTPIYEETQMLLREGRENEAQAIVDNLSDEDWDVYKTMKSSDKRKANRESEVEMYRTVKQVQELLKQGSKSEAQQIVDQMTGDKYATYEKVKRELGLD